MRILVTGTNGFIGHNMMEWLSQEEFWDVEVWNWDPNNLPDFDNDYYEPTPTKEITLEYKEEKVSYYE